MGSLFSFFFFLLYHLAYASLVYRKFKVKGRKQPAGILICLAIGYTILQYRVRRRRVLVHGSEGFTPSCLDGNFTRWSWPPRRNSWEFFLSSSNLGREENMWLLLPFFFIALYCCCSYRKVVRLPWHKKPFPAVSLYELMNVTSSD